jgi:catechol 2,3-dioxygenase-like lactoylglutathione lyase family enzyme
MAYAKKSYLEHVAVHVKDIDWHLRFFKDVLGMTVREETPEGQTPYQVWTIGGMQLMSDPDFNGPEGRLTHLGIMTEDLEEALAEAAKWGVKELPQGRHWIALPDGLQLELIQAYGNGVAEALAAKSRA